MTKLGVVLTAIYEERAAAEPPPVDRLAPEASRVQRVIMVRQVRANFLPLGESGLQTQVTREQRDEIVDAFKAGLWSTTRELVTLVADVGRSAFARLDAEFGIVVGGDRLRALREALTGWTMIGYERDPTIPSAVRRGELCERLVERGRQLEQVVLSEAAFVDRLTPYYSGLNWAEGEHRPEYLLGELTKPPLSDRTLRTVSVGTDRDCFSRYTSYYSLKNRSRNVSTSRMEQWLSDTPPVQVAEHELRRSSRPFGLDQNAHRLVLPVTYFALYGAPVEQLEADDGSDPSSVAAAYRSRPELDGRSLDDSVEVLQRLTATYVSFLRRHRRHGWQLESDPDSLFRSVLRKLWNDLHRLERETEAAATLSWFVGKFKVALDAYAKGQVMSELVLVDPVEDSRLSNREGQSNGGVPQGSATPPGAELVQVALTILSELEPTILLTWALRTSDDRDGVAADLMVAIQAPLDRGGHGDHSAQKIVQIALSVLTGLTSGGAR